VLDSLKSLELANPVQTDAQLALCQTNVKIATMDTSYTIINVFLPALLEPMVLMGNALIALTDVIDAMPISA